MAVVEESLLPCDPPEAPAEATHRERGRAPGRLRGRQRVRRALRRLGVRGRGPRPPTPPARSTRGGRDPRLPCSPSVSPGSRVPPARRSRRGELQVLSLGTLPDTPASGARAPFGRRSESPDTRRRPVRARIDPRHRSNEVRGRRAFRGRSSAPFPLARGGGPARSGGARVSFGGRFLPVHGRYAVDQYGPQRNASSERRLRWFCGSANKRIALAGHCGLSGFPGRAVECQAVNAQFPEDSEANFCSSCTQ